MPPDQETQRPSITERAEILRPAGNRFAKGMVCVVLVVVVALGAPAWLVAIATAIAMLKLLSQIDAQRQDAWEIERENEHARQRLEADWQRRLDQVNVRSELAYSALLQLADGIIVLTPSHEVSLINQAAVNLLGIQNRDKLVGRLLIELVRAPEIVSVVRTATIEGQPQESMVEFKVGDQIRPLRVRVDVIVDPSGQNLQLTVRDESESRRVDEMRREFVANVSHELKTPLAAIKGYAETVQLAASDDPEMAIHFMNQIMSQCQRLEELIRDMIQLARAQAGKVHLNLASVSLTDVIAGSVQTYEPVASAASVRLSFVSQDIDAKVFADAEAVLTIANNLIGNAVRYTPADGEIEVEIESCHGGRQWALIVRDNGIGISTEDQNRIFERFYRGRRTSESHFSSTGLGLAIVKNLSTSMEGTVSVESVTGEGSTFTVELPSATMPSEVIAESAV